MILRGAMLPVLALGFSAAGAMADCTGEGEVTLFGCQTDDGLQSILICGVSLDDNDPQRYRGLRFEQVTAGGVQFSYPPDPRDASKLMFYAHWFEKGLLRAHLRFRNGDDTYRLFWRSTPESTEPDEIAAPDTGVEITKAGKPVETLSCGEDPEWYFDTTRRSAACDLENPHGEAACASDGPEVK